MPTGSPAASQLDTTPSTRRLNAKPMNHAMRSRLATVALALALCSRVGLAAPSLAVIKSSGLGKEWLQPIFYGAAGLVAFLILRAAVQLARKVFPGGSARARNGEIAAKSVEHFVDGTQKLHIDTEIARETIQLLASLLPAETSVGVNDDLRGTLRLSEEEVDSLLKALPDLCGRSSLPVSPASILSVYDLLHYMESLPKAKSGQHYTATGLPVQAAATAPTSPLADLQTASPRDSRFRTRAHFSGVKRRASDYSGPYRRATDRRPDENYAGPLRRASDMRDASSTISDPKTNQRLGDRRSSERRAVIFSETSESAKQHRAVSADTSLLNQCQPLVQDEGQLVPAQMSRERVAVPAAPLQRR